MSIPDPETRLIPEGAYKVLVVEEPEQRSHTGARGKFISVSFKLKLKNEGGETFSHKESFLPWEDRYTDLAYAFGAPEENGRPRMSKIEKFSGKTFKAEIKHESDKNEPGKTWARLANISGLSPATESEPEDVPPPIEAGDDVPF